MVAAGKTENPEVLNSILRSGADAKLRDVKGRRTVDYAKTNLKLRTHRSIKDIDLIRASAP